MKHAAVLIDINSKEPTIIPLDEEVSITESLKYLLKMLNSL